MRHACRVLLACLVLLLAGCAAPPRVRPTADALAATQQVTIVVPPEPKTLHFWGFHPGMAFGAIGGAIAGAQFEQTGNSLMAAVRSQGVLPHETLARALQHELEAAGYSVRIATVSWTDASPVDRLPRLQELGPDHQRVLVLNPRQIGFASFVVTHPYRPLVRLTASLYGPDRSKPLYAGALETGYDIEHSGWTAVPAGPIAMQTQSDLLAEPARMAEALRDALARMAQATTRDLLGARAAPAAGAPVPVAGVPSAVPPGDYAGSLRCGAYDGPDQVPSPAPWVAPVRVSVTGAQASMRRGDANYSESLAGRVDGGSMTLEGRGGMVATPQLYWTTRLWGGFSPDGSRFDGQAHLIDMRGHVFRRCTVDLTKR